VGSGILVSLKAIFPEQDFDLSNVRQGNRRPAPQLPSAAAGNTAPPKAEPPKPVAPGSYADLKKVYQALNAKLVMEKKETEITSLFAAAAAGFMLLAGLLSLLWFNRVL
jgi:hypothetical protein